jgi:hypothetical protein
VRGVRRSITGDYVRSVVGLGTCGEAWDVGGVWLVEGSYGS